MNILITGGAGFIGSNLIRYMLKNTSFIDKIIILDNLHSSNVIYIKDLLKYRKIKFIKGDIRDKSVLSECLNDVDVVVHLAALIDVEESFRDPFIYEDVNSRGTLSLLYSSVKNRVSKFIYASSAAVYGDIEKIPVREDECCHPISPYAVTKLLGEYYCNVYSREYGIECTVLRFFNVYGPGMAMSAYRGVIYNFLINALRGLPLTIFGSGDQMRDFIYVDDVAKSIILSMQNRIGGFQVYNVGTGIGISISSLAQMVSRIMREDIKIKYMSPRKGDIKKSVADISRISAEVGFFPSIKLSEGLIKTLEYLKNMFST